MRQLLWPGKETPGSHLAASRWCRPRGGCCLPDQMSDKRARSQVREGADPPFYSAPLPDELSSVCLSLRVETIKVEVTISSMESEDLNKKTQTNHTPTVSSMVLE